MHVHPQLRELELRFADTLAIVGVHSPKFAAEADPRNLKQAVLRHGIKHPVVSDPHHAVWGSYAVSAWPTAVLVGPDGAYLGQHSGEFEAADMAHIIFQIEREYDARGLLNPQPLPMRPECAGEPLGALCFPGKVLADPASDRLFIADSGHNRIVVADMGGRVHAVIGSGEAGLLDGSASDARFTWPQGMALQDDLLFVADTGNHAVRRVDLTSGTVQRIAGTGRRSRQHRRGGPGLATALASPWDLALDGETLYIAMAGTHQLWALDMAVGDLRRLVGTGREALDDGSLDRCGLAQPSGLALLDGRLYFADSESSAIRVADLTADRVATLVGQGLFEFGDRDGQWTSSLLQHPLAVAASADAVYVADAYNNKVKVLDLHARSVRALAGSGDAHLRDGQGTDACFWEPGGLSLAGRRLYVADTNNHAIRWVDAATGEVGTVAVDAA
jgi:sugar lactone lactonase YvrE